MPGSVTAIRSVHTRPDLAVSGKHQTGQDDQEDQHGKTHALALFHLGVRGPGQERRHVMRFLGDGGSGGGLRQGVVARADGAKIDI